MRKPPILRIALAVLFSVSQAQAIDIRVASFNIRLGLEESGILGRDSVEEIIARINPDVIGLQEVYNSDRAGTPSFLDDLAGSLGFPHVFVPDGAIDPQSRVVILSKYPFLNSWSIGSPAGANEMTRAAAAVLVDLPGTDADPVIVNAHLKCCLEFDDPFRRAVEMIRINEFLVNQGFNSADNIFFLGDFNLIGNSSSYSSLPSGLPPSYQLGNDIGLPVNYSPIVESYFTNLDLSDPGFRQQNGTSTATHSSGSVLDHILVSNPVANRNPQTEIYNSSLDTSFPGLPKSASPLAANTSSDASDHFLIFGDFDIDGGEALTIEVSALSVSELSSPINLTVTLPEPPGAGETVTVSLTSSDTSELIPSPVTLVFIGGQTSADTTLLPRPDLIIDGPQSVNIQASASGFNNASATITVTDSDTNIYLLSKINSPWLQTFEGFTGEQTPAAWTASNDNWRGPDDGTLEIRGPRSYGSSSLGSLSGTNDSFAATFQNSTGSTIKSLFISYLAQQWRSFQSGSLDQWQASVIINGTRTEIPELQFTSDLSQNSGAIDPPLEQQLQ
ncbi:endonuclease/exonuclease/phosphatase family protein, partial [Akkermansiaceae bacterium]|nr:endonuclease/exonuclease/phosphatase family protein [Akkermansiaceae bacterium]